MGRFAALKADIDREVRNLERLSRELDEIDRWFSRVFISGIHCVQLWEIYSRILQPIPTWQASYHATKAEMLSCVALHLVCNVALVALT